MIVSGSERWPCGNIFQCNLSQRPIRSYVSVESWCDRACHVHVMISRRLQVFQVNVSIPANPRYVFMSETQRSTVELIPKRCRSHSHVTLLACHPEVTQRRVFIGRYSGRQLTACHRHDLIANTFFSDLWPLAALLSLLIPVSLSVWEVSAFQIKVRHPLSLSLSYSDYKLCIIQF